MDENNKILARIMSSELFRVRCRVCNSILQSSNSTQIKKCQCGKISIDGGKSKIARRLLGDLNYVDVA
jgi:ribosomal protein S27E